MDTILVVDKDTLTHNQHTAEWAKYHITASRVDTMHDAITILKENNNFIFVAINEDTTPNFISQLRIMRDVTSLPIFVLTSSYTVDKKIKALRHGADNYDAFSEYVKTTVLAALETLKARSRLSGTSSPLSVLAEKDIILSPSRRKVFINDIEVHLTKKEFDILHFLMCNTGSIITHEQLLQKIWVTDYFEYDLNVLWRTVNRLRSKLAAISPNKSNYIKVERNIGYQFLS